MSVGSPTAGTWSRALLHEDLLRVGRRAGGRGRRGIRGARRSPGGGILPQAVGEAGHGVEPAPVDGEGAHAVEGRGLAIDGAGGRPGGAPGELILADLIRGQRGGPRGAAEERGEMGDPAAGGGVRFQPPARASSDSCNNALLRHGPISKDAVSRLVGRALRKDDVLLVRAALLRRRPEHLDPSGNLCRLPFVVAVYAFADQEQFDERDDRGNERPAEQ